MVRNKTRSKIKNPVKTKDKEELSTRNKREARQRREPNTILYVTGVGFDQLVLVLSATGVVGASCLTAFACRLADSAR